MPYNENVGTSKQACGLGTDDHIRVSLRLTAAEQSIAIVGFTRVAIRIIDLSRDDRLLASGAVTHAATIVEIEIMDLAEF